MKRQCPHCGKNGVRFIGLIKLYGATCSECKAKVQTHWAWRALLYFIGFPLFLYFLVRSVDIYGGVSLVVAFIAWLIIELGFSSFAPIEIRKRKNI